MRRLLPLILVSSTAVAEGEWSLYRSTVENPAAREYVASFLHEVPLPKGTLSERNRLECQATAAAMEEAADRDPKCAVESEQGPRWWCEPGTYREAWR